MKQEYEKASQVSKGLRGVAAVALIAGTLGQAQAFPTTLGLTVDFPDVVTNVLDVNYNNGDLTIASSASSTGAHLASSVAVSDPIQNLSYSLMATLNPAGGALLSGTLNIVGGIANLGIPNGTTLLSGNLTDFGFAGGVGGAGVFEFILDVTASAPVLNFGTQANVIFSSFGISPGTFDETVNFSGTGNADNAAPPTSVPAPGVLSLLVLGALSGIGAGSSRRARRA